MSNKWLTQRNIVSQVTAFAVRGRPPMAHAEFRVESLPCLSVISKKRRLRRNTSPQDWATADEAAQDFAIEPC
jgi:hypothetical protein